MRPSFGVIDAILFAYVLAFTVFAFSKSFGAGLALFSLIGSGLVLGIKVGARRHP